MGVQSIAVFVSVCLSVCPFAYLKVSQNFLYMLLTAVAWSYDDSAIRYILLKSCSCSGASGSESKTILCFIAFASRWHWRWKLLSVIARLYLSFVLFLENTQVGDVWRRKIQRWLANQVRLTNGHKTDVCLHAYIVRLFMSSPMQYVDDSGAADVCKEKHGSVKRERRYKCSSCTYTAYTRSILQRHEARHAPCRRPQYRCDVCGARLMTVYSLNEHKRLSHVEDRPFPCAICGFTAKCECLPLSQSVTQCQPAAVTRVL